MSNDPVYDAVAKAKRQRESGNPAGAAQTLEACLATDPHCIAPRLELANIYVYDLKQRRTGLMQLDVLLDLDPDNIEVLKAATTVKMTDKHLNQEVDEEYRKLVQLVAARKDPREFGAVCAAYAVFLRLQLTDFTKAGEYYEKAVAACPDRYEYHQDYAVLLLNDLKDYPKAKHELEEVLRLRPESASAKKNYNVLMQQKFNADGTVKKTFWQKMRGH
ncbi:MAG: hypothetical protein WCQ63_03240 [Methanomethylophilus sp.]|nr:hypothetical protein [Methanomethylophilus sp.]